MYVHCGTVYNGKDLEPTQMSINNRLDKENVVHVYHGIPCSHKKWWGCILHRDMDEPGNHHSQQTYRRTETKHCMLSLIGRCWIIRTHGHREESITYCGQLGRAREGTAGLRRVRRDNEGRNTSYRWWEDEFSKPPCHVFTYATVLHDLHMYPRT